MHALIAFVLAIASCSAPPSWTQSGREPTSPRARTGSTARAGDALINATVVREGDAVRMIDASTGVVLLAPAGKPIWSPDDPRQIPTGVNPASVEINPQPGGFDAVVRLTNPTQRPMSPGAITITGFRFGRAIHSRDFRFDGKEVTIDHLNRPYSPGGWFYPDGLYSPVAMMGEGDYRVAASLLYPILDYKHQVRIGVFARRVPKERSLVWEFSFNLNAPGEDARKLSEDGFLAPGEQRTYTVCIRAVHNPDAWQQTLEPYRRFFRENYGEVRYDRDPRPVRAFSTAASGQIRAGNPLGFRQDRLRPDLHGYGPVADELITYVNRGWKRTMVWAAAGATDRGEHKNVPYKFSAQWRAGPGVNARMQDFSTQLPRVERSGGDLGLWWSRSTMVATSWDPPTFIDMDPTNSEHVSAVLADLDAAVAAGATMIGLDAFRRMDIWEAYDWMQILQQRAPDVKFVVEPPLGDVMHTLAPCFLLATRAGEGDLRLETRHYLADFLNPGHETWGFTRVDRLESFLGRPATATDVATEMQRVATLGYVPIASTGLPVDQRLVAAESWRTLPPPSRDPAADAPVVKKRTKKKGASSDEEFEFGGD